MRDELLDALRSRDIAWHEERTSARAAPAWAAWTADRYGLGTEEGP